MAYTGETFPKHISRESSGGPAFEVDIVTSQSGVEWRNQVTAMPRWEFEVSHAAQTEDRYVPLQKFFLTHGAQADSFRYWDPLDYIVAAGEGDFLAIDSTHFQMRKKYVYGSLVLYRTITKPDSGTEVITGGTVASTDYDTGIVTMTTGTPTSWTGKFHVHARFNDRKMTPTIIDRHARGSYIVQWAPIPVVEIKTAD